MSASTSSLFLLRWKGVESGPFSLREIRELLSNGDISRMHQIQVNGRWKLLDDFAELDGATDPRTESRAIPVERESLRPFIETDDEFSRPFDLKPITRVSGLAIAALIVSLGGFIPYVNFISWIPALALGHLALRQIDGNSGLTGRGLALTGLAITYFVLLVGTTYVALALYHGRSLF